MTVRTPPPGLGTDAGGAPASGPVAEQTRAIRRGDSRALARFYTDWFDWCYRTVRARTGRDEAFCLDVVQEAMLRVVRSVPVLTSEGDVRRWLGSVLRSAAIDLLRRERRRQRAERGAPLGHVSEPDDDAHAWVREALETLPEEDRLLVHLRFGRSRTLSQIARSLGTTVGTVHGRLRRSVRRLAGADRKEDL